jgi:5-formyltetrahydrofolate cyclo-ligase
MAAPPASPTLHRISATLHDDVEAKAALRSRMRALRQSMPAGDAVAASAAASCRALADLGSVDKVDVAVFLSLPSEIETTHLIEGLSSGGARLCLPRMVGRGQPLLFHRWTPGDELRAGSMGVREPLPGSPEVVPEIVIVPLLAFDGEGHRLGYGGGYYDRTLARLRRARAVTAIGFAFEMQRVDRLPKTDYDQPLDRIVTEAAVHAARHTAA